MGVIEWHLLKKDIAERRMRKYCKKELTKKKKAVSFEEAFIKIIEEDK